MAYLSNSRCRQGKCCAAIALGPWPTAITIRNPLLRRPLIEMGSHLGGIRHCSVVNKYITAAELDQGVYGGSGHASCSDNKTGRFGWLDRVTWTDGPPETRHDRAPVRVITKETLRRTASISRVGVVEDGASLAP